MSRSSARSFARLQLAHLFARFTPCTLALLFQQLADRDAYGVEDPYRIRWLGDPHRAAWMRIDYGNPPQGGREPANSALTKMRPYP